MKFHLKAGMRVVAALATSTSMLTLGNLASTSRPASADPGTATAATYVGVGSDTLQDLVDAYSGANPYPPSTATIFYTPMHSSAGTGNKTVTSWDAVPAGGVATAPGCIIAKYGGSSFDRPNGSGDGIAALSHAIDSTPWYAGSPGPAKASSCTGSVSTANVFGQIDFARSSRGPSAGTSPCTASSTANCLDYVPFARDAVGFAFFDHNTGTISTLTTAQLTALYSSASGTIMVGADTVHACITQNGSGTTKFWEGAIGVTAAQADAASNASGCTPGPTSTLEENGGNTFYAYASTLAANNDAVVDFSVGSWIAQANGVALDRSATARANFVDIGIIAGIGGGTGVKPYTGTPGTEAPAPSYYADTTFGRNINVVVQQSRLGTFGDAGLKSLFSGPTSVICSATAQGKLPSFGFEALASGCGSTAVTANLYS